ncbi:hypothetical protein KI387_000194, partial [Taxus chinensis]
MQAIDVCSKIDENNHGWQKRVYDHGSNGGLQEGIEYVGKVDLEKHGSPKISCLFKQPLIESLRQGQQ